MFIVIISLLNVVLYYILLKYYPRKIINFNFLGYKLPTNLTLCGCFILIGLGIFGYMSLFLILLVFIFNIDLKIFKETYDIIFYKIKNE